MNYRKLFAEKNYPKHCRYCEVSLELGKTVTSYNQWKKGMCKICYFKFRRGEIRPRKLKTIKDSIPQKILFEELKRRIKGDLRYNFPIRTLKFSNGLRRWNVRYADIADIKRRMVFEYDGEQWHKRPDKKRDDELKMAGWKVIHVNKHNIQKVLDSLIND